ncbi:unnamed protein product [Dibothriocephalus latus]|uniref:Guanylate cyclase domain-containing protein n=1 Tax=Dibothriocephalus latus TaxID=60516 RepID=A0A3P7P2L9_DIBLA|nr:unnamed protein product [Dibothriocephalus latus]
MHTICNAWAENPEMRPTFHDISKSLEQSMHDSCVAQDLIGGNPVPPETFTQATIYFSDIVGFSHIIAKSTGYQIVDFLNDLYSAFDTAIQMFDVYKVSCLAFWQT